MTFEVLPNPGHSEVPHELLTALEVLHSGSYDRAAFLLSFNFKQEVINLVPQQAGNTRFFI